MDFMIPETVADLKNVRDTIVIMEDTIIFSLLERSQFYSSPSVYDSGKFPLCEFEGSFLEWSLLQLEKNHSQIRRFDAPDEIPFFPGKLLAPIIHPVNYPRVLASYSNEINVNDEILKFYVKEIVPRVSCEEGEQQENMGSVSVSDINCLSAISRRIHFGKFVAEAKFQENREEYIKLIKANDRSDIEAFLTNKAVEAEILERLESKSKIYRTNLSLKCDIQDIIVNLYKKWIIPLTINVEVDYLLRRLEDT